MIKDMWRDGWVGKLLVVILFLLIAMLISLPFIMYYDHLEMKLQHCQRTNETREGYYIQHIYNAKGMIISSYPVPTTEYKYTCDDGIRWR